MDIMYTVKGSEGMKSGIYRVSKKKWDLKKYVYCSEGHKNQANQILILCMFLSTLGHLV